MEVFTQSGIIHCKLRRRGHVVDDGGIDDMQGPPDAAEMTCHTVPLQLRPCRTSSRISSLTSSLPSHACIILYMIHLYLGASLSCHSLVLFPNPRRLARRDHISKHLESKRNHDHQLL